MVGTFVLSLDTEIAWGTYGDLQGRAAAFDAFPALVRRLIRQLDIYEIAATWAVVGHLLLGEGEQTDVPQPHYSFATSNDSQRLADRPPAWAYAPYLRDWLMNTRTPQDIGSHTFTHVLATDSGVDCDLFHAQLAATVALHERLGLPAPRSLVYPQNRVAYIDALPSHGFTVYRGVAADWYAGWPAPLKRPAHLLDRALAFTPPTYPHPVPPSTLMPVNVPASQFLMSYDGVRNRIPTAARVNQAKRGLARAVARDEVFHLWFHPFNLASSPAMFEALVEILAHVWTLRESGQLAVQTMADLAAPPA